VCSSDLSLGGTKAVYYIVLLPCTGVTRLRLAHWVHGLLFFWCTISFILGSCWNRCAKMTCSEILFIQNEEFLLVLKRRTIKLYFIWKKSYYCNSFLNVIQVLNNIFENCFDKKELFVTVKCCLSKWRWNKM